MSPFLWLLCSTVPLLVFSQIDYDWDTLPSVRGYNQRACGFDLNGNGIIGEASDCNKICNGMDEGLGSQYIDVDNDGIIETQYYVNCDTGSDTLTCGDVSNPCKSIHYTWNTRTFGPTIDGGEDIICFTGICLNESLISPGVSGNNSYFIKTKSGSEEYDFQFPLNPTILCGWDTDNDHQYPPYDRDDISIIDGSINKLTRFIDIGSNGYPASFVEMAHFEVTGFGTFAYDSDDKGFMYNGRGTNSIISHWYMHDLSVWNINREVKVLDGQSSSTISLFNWFGFNELQYYAIINCEFIDFCQYGHRGGMIPEPEPPFEEQNHHIRMQNILWRPYCNGSNNNEFSTVSKMWGIQNNWEWIDNVFDGNVAPYGPSMTDDVGRLTGVLVNECCRNIIIRNNYFYNYFSPMSVTGYTSGYCSLRTTSNIIMDHNIVYHDTDYFKWSLGNGVTINDDQDNTPIEASIENVTISYNIFDASDPANWQTLFQIAVGNQDSEAIGVIKIYGNEVKATSIRSGFGVFMFGDISSINGIPFPQQNYEIHDNKVFGLKGDSFTDHHKLYICVDSNCPSNIQSDNNVYSACGNFKHYGTNYDSNQWYSLFQSTYWNNQDINTKWCHVKECNMSSDVNNVVQPSDSNGCDSITLFSYDYQEPTIIRTGFDAKPKDYIQKLLQITNSPTNAPIDTTTKPPTGSTSEQQTTNSGSTDKPGPTDSCNKLQPLFGSMIVLFLLSIK